MDLEDLCSSRAAVVTIAEAAAVLTLDVRAVAQPLRTASQRRSAAASGC